MEKIIGYWIEEVPKSGFDRIRIRWWPLLDGPIEAYIAHPEIYIVTPIYK